MHSSLCPFFPFCSSSLTHLASSLASKRKSVLHLLLKNMTWKVEIPVPGWGFTLFHLSSTWDDDEMSSSRNYFFLSLSVGSFSIKMECFLSALSGQRWRREKEPGFESKLTEWERMFFISGLRKRRTSVKITIVTVWETNERNVREPGISVVEKCWVTDNAFWVEGFPFPHRFLLTLEDFWVPVDHMEWCIQLCMHWEWINAVGDIGFLFSPFFCFSFQSSTRDVLTDTNWQSAFWLRLLIHFLLISFFSDILPLEFVKPIHLLHGKLIGMCHLSYVLIPHPFPIWCLSLSFHLKKVTFESSPWFLFSPSFQFWGDFDISLAYKG